MSLQNTREVGDVKIVMLGAQSGSTETLQKIADATIADFRDHTLDIVYGINNDDHTRMSADVSSFGFVQGCTVGITDYTTYSIAFGDGYGNFYNDGWNTNDVTADDPTIFPICIAFKRNDGTEMHDSDRDALMSQIHMSIGTCNIEFAPIVYSKKKKNTGYIHISLDDCDTPIINLVANASTYTSIFDEPLLAFLKVLHDTYGARFSIYVMYIESTFGNNIPTKYQQEFIENSDWLKFGFHAYTDGSSQPSSYQQAKTWYETFVDDIYTLCGGLNSIDRMPRLDYYAGTLDVCKGYRDAECGIIGLLGADAVRTTYYLSSDERDYLNSHGVYYDAVNGLAFVDTVMRLDWFLPDASSIYPYNEPVKSTPYEELKYRYNETDMGMLYNNLIVFVHEPVVYSQGALTEKCDWMEQVCRFGQEYDYDFDYPQNRLQNITSFSLSNKPSYPSTLIWSKEKNVNQFTNVSSKYRWTEDIDNSIFDDADALLIEVYWFDGASGLFPVNAISRVVNMNDIRSNDGGHGCAIREYTYFTLSNLSAVMQMEIGINRDQGGGVLKSNSTIDLTSDAYNISPSIQSGKVGIYIYKLK